MTTVGKAISLLELFSVAEPELGLTELSRRSGFDKATTRRLLVTLTAKGLVEQDATTRLYRLGAALTRLARIREARLPLIQTATPFVRRLAVEIAETVHLSQAHNGTLTTVTVEHPQRANRVNVNVGGFLPLHSTASGIAYLAHLPEITVEQALSVPLASFTAHTQTDPALVRLAIDVTRRRGYSLLEQGFEEGVSSVGAAILGADGVPVGTLAIASPMARSPKAAMAERGQAVARAAAEISALLNG